MTRHNLDAHLRWLISTRPSVPPDVSLPPVTTSFGSIAATALDDINDIPDGAFDDDISEASTEVPEEPEIQARTTEMARLRTAPGSPTKPRLISAGPGSQLESGSRAASIPASKWKQTVQSAVKTESVPQTPVKSGWEMPASGSDVEVMDLTDSLEKMRSPSFDRVARTGTGRKRKSEEYRADLNDCPRHGSPVSAKVQRTTNGLASAGGRSTARSGEQAEYTPIEEVMDEAHSEPPPARVHGRARAGRPAAAARTSRWRSTGG